MKKLKNSGKENHNRIYQGDGEEMNWTKVKPKQDGYFWYRAQDGECEIVHVEKNLYSPFYKKNVFMVATFGTDYETELDGGNYDGEWSDEPIPEPGNEIRLLHFLTNADTSKVDLLI